ncbi:MAG: hypothetical protein ACK55Z_37035, partial [bacterium]
MSVRQSHVTLVVITTAYSNPFHLISHARTSASPTEISPEVERPAADASSRALCSSCASSIASTRSGNIPR